MQYCVEEKSCISDLLSSFPPARMGHAMATGILGRVGMPAFRFGTFGSRWMMRKITAVASYFLLLDAWLLSRCVKTLYYCYAALLSDVGYP